MSLLGDFKKFLLRGNVVDLAVVIGTAFGLVVKALVADLLTPIIALIFGQPDSARCCLRSTRAASLTATSSTA